MFEKLIDRQRFARRQFFNRLGHGQVETMIGQRSIALEAISPRREDVDLPEAYTLPLAVVGL